MAYHQNFINIFLENIDNEEAAEIAARPTCPKFPISYSPVNLSENFTSNLQ